MGVLICVGNIKTNMGWYLYIVLIVSLDVMVVQIFDIVTALTFPEKLIYEYVNQVILNK